MSVKLLTEHLLEFLSSKGGCTGSSESTLVKMPHCWKSHVTAHISCKWLTTIKMLTVIEFTISYFIETQDPGRMTSRS